VLPIPITRFGLILAIGAATVAACSAPRPTMTPSPALTVGPTQATAEASIPASASPIAESYGELSFVRPASWFETRPASPINPGAYLFLSSVPLNVPCPPTMGAPIACLADGTLPDGGVLISIGSGATLGPGGTTPRPIVSAEYNQCAPVGGFAVSTGVNGAYVSACLRGTSASSAFDTFVRSLHWSPPSG
jgi:hypothetical protein